VLIEENKNLIRLIIKEWNEVNGETARIRPLFDKYYKLGFVYHDLTTGDTDREQTIRDMEKYLSAFPDAKYFIDEIVAEGDKTVIICTLRCTHKGMFKGIPATNKKVVVNQVEIHKIAENKIAEAWGFSDSHGMMNQLGIKNTL
jgi:predicted ester cyclase